MEISLTNSIIFIITVEGHVHHISFLIHEAVEAISDSEDTEDTV